MKNISRSKLAWLALIIGYLIFGSFTLSLGHKKKVFRMQYNGVFFVALDHYSIYKYNSPDVPKRIIEIHVNP